MIFFLLLTGIYLTVTMAMTSLSIILTVFVLQLHHVSPHQKKVPKWLRVIMFEIIARLVRMRSNVKQLQGHDSSTRQEDICLSTFMESRDEKNCNGSLRPHQGTVSRTRYFDKHGQRETKDKITNHLKILISKQDSEEEYQDVVNQWRLVAQIMDRFLFWLFLIGSTISTIIILVFLPMGKPVEHVE